MQSVSLNTKVNLVSAFVFVVELAIINVLCYFFSTQSVEGQDYIRTHYKTFNVLVNLCYVIAHGLTWIRSESQKKGGARLFLKVLKSFFLFLLISGACLLYLCQWQNFVALDLSMGMTLSAIAFVLILLCRFAAWKALKLYNRKNPKNVVLLGSGSIANSVINNILNKSDNNYKFLGCFDDRPREYMVVDPNDYLLGMTEDLQDFLRKNKVDIIICALPAGNDAIIVKTMNYAEDHMIRFMLVPDFIRFIATKVNLTIINDIPVIQVRKEPMKGFMGTFIKRTFDLLCSTLFLVFCFLPIFLVVAIAIKLDDGGNIFFRQRRTGTNGKAFWCYKFRSMRKNKDADTRMATKDDDRLTRVGKFMRKTDIDELPQFINVWLGNMSLVGPRPLMESQTSSNRNSIPRYMQRHFVRPGITGLSQISGYRGEVRDSEKLRQRSEIDLWYVEHWSFWLDIRIIGRTALSFIKGDERAY